jgi:RepB DNA-primase from phage plasmid/CHC2 zinc finger
VSAGRVHPAQELFIYLRMLAGEPGPNRFFDVRWATPAGGMNRRFVSAVHIHDAARLITRLAFRTDVYVGVALRDGHTSGGRSAIGGSHLLYIECDDPGAGKRLHGFVCSPSMIVASGSPGHLHVYWCLRERASSAQVQSANRRLALALQGDPASVDIARLLRPPSSMNHKHSPPVAVRLLEHNTDARYALRELTSSLPEDPYPEGATAGRPVRQSARRTALDRELLAIPAAEYVRVLAGLEANQAGKVLCPFHRETNSSLQLYPDGSFYCFGSGCRRGGTIYDFAAAKWLTGQSRDVPLRGRDFLELRRRLASAFHLEQPSIQDS